VIFILDNNHTQKRQRSIEVLIFGATIFSGAFLLFSVQPLLGRFLLPWFGGSSEVWTTCMLFFQVFLLCGYLYAYFLAKLKNFGLQIGLHVALLLLALFFLPIVPKDIFKPTGSEYPIPRILLICSMTVGLPYLLLAATSPLIQVWFSRSFPNRNPYRLYALSNMGSLLSLVSFPFVFEPLMTRNSMAYIWSVGFGVFGILCAGSMLLSRKHTALSEAEDKPFIKENTKLPKRIGWLWVALPAGASVELLAVTNRITQDIAVVPFLWVLPLSLYLLSFIICFEHPRWYRRKVFVPLFILGIVATVIARFYEIDMSSATLVGFYVFMLFNCCMVCHGEVYRLRPGPAQLTSYYLMIATGGALGGFFVAVLCPLLFNTYIELYLGLAVCMMFLLLAEEQTNPTLKNSKSLRRRTLMVLLCVASIYSILLMGKRSMNNQRGIENRRNFFGVLTIWQDNWNDPVNDILLMQHGTTFHGSQFQSPGKKDIPTAYYGPDSGIGLVMRNWPVQYNRRIGIIGLGTGTLAIYGNKNDFIRFYEINPEVERLARQYFTYLEDSKATVDITLGDGRLVMENQPSQNYDILVLDAFSSDAVPTHLLTTEAMTIYLKHLADNGVMAFHISTQHLDLQSIVWKLAEHFDLETAWIESGTDETTGSLASHWILLARDKGFLGMAAIETNKSHPYADLKKTPLWTDDHINLLKIIK